MAPICRQHFGLGIISLHRLDNKHMLIICQG
jgi:hypothetical protein